MQRDRVARAHFQDVRRAIKVSPYHVLGSTGYLVATRHKWAPAEYRRADGHTRLIAAQWPCVADRREGVAVAEVYLAYGLIVAPSIARRSVATTDPNPRILYCATETLRDGASNEAFPIRAKRNPPTASGSQRRRSSCGDLQCRRHNPTHLLTAGAASSAVSTFRP
jgi:hypothetical protein